MPRWQVRGPSLAADFFDDLEWKFSWLHGEILLDILKFS